MSMEAFIGRWHLDSSENFDEYMKELGVGMIMRKMGATAKPDVIFSVDGDTVTLKTESSFKNTSLTFKLGVEFDETTMDGRECKTTFTLNGDELVQVQQCGDKTFTISRKVSGNKLTVLLKAGNVTCTRYYHKD